MLTLLRTRPMSFPATASHSLRVALLVFFVVRVLLSVWAVVVIEIVPAPLDPDPILRPYQGQPALLEGAGGMLLGPWQRFDTMRYLALAQEGYNAQNSVFPPVYPLLIGGVGRVIELLTPATPEVAGMTAALIISNVALIAALALLHYVTTQELDEASAERSLAYLVFFPTGFFLFAAYSESLFLLFGIGALWLARRDEPLWAGMLGMLAALTRLTGWALCLPLVYEYARQRLFNRRNLDWRIFGAALPPLGLLAFLIWRNIAGLPPLNLVYEQFWFQRTALPGADVWIALQSALTGSGPRAKEFSLVLDVLVTGLLLITTVLAFRRLGPTYGIYGSSMLLFMLLPSSEVKPIYSFSRYALMFFPTFMLMGDAGRRPWLHRLILYSSLILLLFFSGQFFLWGWVA